MGFVSGGVQHLAQQLRRAERVYIHRFHRKHGVKEGGLLGDAGDAVKHQRAAGSLFLVRAGAPRGLAAHHFGTQHLGIAQCALYGIHSGAAGVRIRGRQVLIAAQHRNFHILRGKRRADLCKLFLGDMAKSAMPAMPRGMASWAPV